MVVGRIVILVEVRGHVGMKKMRELRRWLPWPPGSVEEPSSPQQLEFGHKVSCRVVQSRMSNRSCGFSPKIYTMGLFEVGASFAMFATMSAPPPPDDG